ncbi:hypothetical protein DFH11DRAFT_1140888 [Phellopilus nigrolimitatus]|nr:hypothetical protein DFH11DRAFT_1140888 [Phellopilus nigrolimitatus]
MLPRCLFSQAQAQAHRRSHGDLRRYLRSSPQHRALVGPPDPVSNLRPVIYDDVDYVDTRGGRRRKGKGREDREANNSQDEDGGSARALVAFERTRTSPTHPYLLDEFDGDPLDYQWRVERKRLDAYNHAFWADSNARFEGAKRAVLSSLPESASPDTREAALSEFYGNWLRQEHGRLKEYSDDWSRKNFGGILLAARAAIRQFRARIFGRESSAAASMRSSSPSTPHPPPSVESRSNDDRK